jgi:hypothetical protein
MESGNEEGKSSPQTTPTLMPTEKKCLRCGGTQLQPGKIKSTGKIWFKPEKTKFLTLKTSNVDMHASLCLDCGTIDLAGDPGKAKALTKAAKAR